MLIEPRPLDPQEWARVHDQDDPRHFVFRRGVELAGEWCTALISKDARWVDAGCGTGHLTAAMASAGANVTGVDRSLVMLHYSAIRWSGPDRRLEFIAADAGDLPFPDSTLAGIAAVSLLGCVRRTERLFREFARVLRPGGVLCLSATNRHSIPLALMGVRRRLGNVGQTVERYFSYDPRLLVEELRRAGFVLERQRLYGRSRLLNTADVTAERDVKPGVRSVVSSNLMILARLGR